MSDLIIDVDGVCGGNEAAEKEIDRLREDKQLLVAALIRESSERKRLMEENERIRGLLYECNKVLSTATYHDGRYLQATHEEWQTKAQELLRRVRDAVMGMETKK